MPIRVSGKRVASTDPGLPVGGTAQVVTYVKPSGAPDAVWTTIVNGQGNWTHYTTRGATTHYSTDAAGPVTIQMNAPTTVTECIVRLSQEGVWPPPVVTPTFAGSQISFTLPQGFLGSAMVRINNALPGATLTSWQSFATVTALPLETDVPAPASVSYYFGPGVHTGPPINMASNQTMYVAPGALLKRRVVAGQIGINTTNQRTNIRIWGRGIIDTSNGYGPTDTGLGAGDFAGVNGLTIEGISYVSRYSWALALYRCTNVMIDRVRVFSCEIPDAPSYTAQGTPDGVDPVACNGFTLRRSLVSASDDTSAIKLDKYGEFGNGSDHLYEDLLVIQGGKSNGMDIGYELGAASRSITNVTYRRMYAPICWRDTQSFRTNTFGIHVCSNATVDTVLFEDCRADEARNKDWDLFISTFYTSGYSISTAGDANRGYIRNITYRRCEFPQTVTGQKRVHISADLSDPNYEGGAKRITNLTFDHCTRAGVPLTAAQSDWTVTNVANLQFLNG